MACIACLTHYGWLVLKNRVRAAPLRWGSAMVWIAHRLDIPLVPVIFPTQMILRAEWLDGGDVVNQSRLTAIRWMNISLDGLAER